MREGERKGEEGGERGRGRGRGGLLSQEGLAHTIVSVPDLLDPLPTSTPPHPPDSRSSLEFPHFTPLLFTFIPQTLASNAGSWASRAPHPHSQSPSSGPGPRAAAHKLKGLLANPGFEARQSPASLLLRHPKLPTILQTFLPPTAAPRTLGPGERNVPSASAGWPVGGNSKFRDSSGRSTIGSPIPSAVAHPSRSRYAERLGQSPRTLWADGAQAPHQALTPCSGAGRGLCGLALGPPTAKPARARGAGCTEPGGAPA